MFNPTALFLERENMGGLEACPIIHISVLVNKPSEDTLSISSPHAPVEIPLAAPNTVGRESAHSRLITEFDRVCPS
jgi:hypothetical protein